MNSTQYLKSTTSNSCKSFITTLILSVFLGILGVHRFYVGKLGTGFIWLFTLGLFGVGYIADIVIITSQSFEDKKNLPIVIN